MSESSFPAVYHGATGRPMLWHEDAIGDLKLAVEAFFYLDVALTPERVELVRAYLAYFVNAPVWDKALPACALKILGARELVKELRGPRDLWWFLAECLAIGLDPL